MVEPEKPFVVFVGDAPAQPLLKTPEQIEQERFIEAKLRKTGLMVGWERTLERTKGRPETSLRRRVRGVLKEDAKAARERVRRAA